MFNKNAEVVSKPKSTDLDILYHDDDNEFALGVFSVIVGMMIVMLSTVVIWRCLHRAGMHISFSLVVIIESIFISFGIYSIEILNDHNALLSHVNSDLLGVCVHPTIMFYVVYTLDEHYFFRCLSQSIVISTIGMLINIFIYAAFLHFIRNHVVDWTSDLFSAIVLVSIDVSNTKPLKALEYFPYLSNLLEVECIFGASMCLFFVDTWDPRTKSFSAKMLHLIISFVSSVSVGIVCGVLFGYLFRKLCSSDRLNCVVVSIFVAYFPYIFSVFVLQTSGSLAGCITFIFISLQRSRLSPEIDRYILMIWTELYFLVEIMLFMLMQLKLIILILKHSNDISMIGLSFGAYLLGNASRMIALFAISPILSRTGCGISIKSMFMLSWYVRKGPLQMLTGFYYISKLDPKDEEIAYISTVLFFYVFYSHIINESTLQTVLKQLGLTDISSMKRSTMFYCIKFIQEKRSMIISIMKMNRFYSDANWAIIQNSTNLENPYLKSSQGNMDTTDYAEFDIDLFRNNVVCPECRFEITIVPTNKEMKDMARYGKTRVLKTLKLSYLRQYEKGLLSKEAIRVLLQAISVAMNSPDLTLKLDELFKQLKKKTLSEKLFPIISHILQYQKVIIPPTTYYRNLCYKIVFHEAYIIYINLICMLDLCSVIYLIVYLIMNNTDKSTFVTIIAISGCLFFVYVIDLILYIFAYSRISIRDGVRLYFKNHWHKLDVCLLLFYCYDVWILYAYATGYIGINDKINYLRCVKLIRLVSLLHSFAKCFSQFLIMCEKHMEMQICYLYDVAKAIVVGYEEVIQVLPRLIESKLIQAHVRMNLDMDRLSTTKELCMIQMERTWITLVVKTKQATRSTLNSMNDQIEELKVTGFADDGECRVLANSLDDLYTHLNSLMNDLNFLTPKNIFSEIPWINPEDVYFMYGNVTTKIWDPGDVICSNGDIAEGIYIIVAGFFKLYYNPSDITVNQLINYGVLPIRDNIVNTRFGEKQEDYIMVGNSIGELSVMTGRPYSCTIISDTPSQAFIIPTAIVKQAMSNSNDPINGLECRIWKHISTQLAASILSETPAYYRHTQEQMNFNMERCFVPNMKCYNSFVITDMIKDVVLIDGNIDDFDTKQNYVAPAYIPKTVGKLLLPMIDDKSRLKLLIVPIPDVDEYDVMEKVELLSDLVENISSSCLVHVVRKKDKHRRKKHVVNKKFVGRTTNQSRTKQKYKGNAHISREYMSQLSLAQRNFTDSSTINETSNSQSLIGSRVISVDQSSGGESYASELTLRRQSVVDKKLSFSAKFSNPVRSSILQKSTIHSLMLKDMQMSTLSAKERVRVSNLKTGTSQSSNLRLLASLEIKDTVEHKDGSSEKTITKIPKEGIIKNFKDNNKSMKNTDKDILDDVDNLET